MSYFIRVATPSDTNLVVPQYWEQQIVSPTQSNVYYNDGYVGLGIPNPLSRLAVDGGATFGGTLYTQAAGDGNVLMSGACGIGAAINPYTKLTVDGMIWATDKLLVSGDPANFTTGAGLAGIPFAVMASGSAANDNCMALFQNTTGNRSGICLANNSASQSGIVNIFEPTTYVSRLSFITDYYPTVPFPYPITEAMVIQGNGSIGMGTTAPTHKLHVIGNTKIDGNTTINGDLTVTGTTTTINAETIISDQLIINNAGTGSALIVDQTGAQPIVEFKDDGATVFKIVNGGSVGIGTTLPATKLDVLGNITASAIDITGGSPTQVPIHINAGGYTVIPNDGAIERDPQVFYGSTANNLRGVIACESHYVLRADRLLGSVVTAQEFFPTYVNLLAGTTYLFEANITMSRSAGTTSHQIRSLFGGTATYSKVRYTVSATVLNAASACVMTSIEVTTQMAITPANAVASEINVFRYNGLISVATSGTFYLQFNYTVAPGGAPTVQSESWQSIKPIGSETFVRNEGGWT